MTITATLPRKVVPATITTNGILAVLLCAISADIATTVIGLSLGLVETNPFARTLYHSHGYIGLLIPHLLGLVTATTLALIHPWPERTFQLIGIFYASYTTYAVINNIQLIIDVL